MIVVVDASVWVSAILIADAFYTESSRWFWAFHEHGGRVAAPITLVAEVAGAIARRSGRSDIAYEYALDIQTDPRVRLYSVDAALGDAAAQLAAHLPLKMADAVYVALAQGLGTPLVTRDREQLARGSTVIQTMTPEEMESR